MLQHYKRVRGGVGAGKGGAVDLFVGFDVSWGGKVFGIEVPGDKGLVAPRSGGVLGQGGEGAIRGADVGWTNGDDGGDDIVVLLELFVDLLGGEGGEICVLISVGTDKVAGVLHVGEDGGVGCDCNVYVIGCR